MVKDSKDKEKKTILKADRNVLQRIITAYEAGYPVDLLSVLKHELHPVSLSLAEMNGTLCTGNKSFLAVMTAEAINCPEATELHEASSCLITDGQTLVVALEKPNNPQTFGDVADTYISTVLRAGAKYQWTDVVFDRYREETIKGSARRCHSNAIRPVTQLIEGCDVPIKKKKNGTIFSHWGILKLIQEIFCPKNCVHRHQTTEKLYLLDDSGRNLRSGHHKEQLI